jgi:hypothetical protein
VGESTSRKDATLPIQVKSEETVMNDKPTLARPRGVTIAVAAALSTVVAIGILAAVTALFQSRGAPMEQLAAAERACAEHAYVSQRENCMREWLAASRAQSVASK